MLKTWQKLVSLQILYYVIENLDLSVMYRTHFQPWILVYIPIIMLTLTDKFMNLIEQHTMTHQQHHQNTNHQEKYLQKGTQTDIITPLCRLVPISNIPGPFTFIVQKIGHHKTITTMQIVYCIF